MRNIFIFLIVLTLWSCDSSTVFHQYQPIAEGEWKVADTISFTIENKDTIARKNIYIRLRNDNNYPFSTIFLVSKMIFPNGEKVVDTLQYEMANEKGEWLGTGFSSVKENKLFYKENVVFPQKGTYKFSIRQVTRGIDDVKGVEPLKGILNVGLQIENVN